MMITVLSLNPFTTDELYSLSPVANELPPAKNLVMGSPGSLASRRKVSMVPPLTLKTPATDANRPRGTKIIARDAKSYDIVNRATQVDVRKNLGNGVFGYVKQVQVPLSTMVVSDPPLEQGFAIKINKDSDTISSLKREMATARSINHPRILDYLGAAIQSEGDVETKIEIVMELMAGNLSGLIGKELPAEKKLALLRDIAEGLVYLHDQGLVHNDIKLDNVLLNEEGRAVIGDLGRTASYTESCDNMTSVVAPEMSPLHPIQLEIAKRGEQASDARTMDDLSHSVFSVEISPVTPLSAVSSDSTDSGYCGNQLLSPGQLTSRASVAQSDGKTDVYGLAYVAMQLLADKHSVSVWEESDDGDGVSTIAPELESYRQKHRDNPQALAALDKLILPGLSLQRDNRPTAKEALSVIEELLAMEPAGTDKSKSV